MEERGDNQYGCETFDWNGHEVFDRPGYIRKSISGEDLNEEAVNKYWD